MKWVLVSSYDIFRFLQVYFCKFRKQQISKANRILSSISCLANNAGKGHNFQSNFIIFKETFAKSCSKEDTTRCSSFSFLYTNSFCIKQSFKRVFKYRKWVPKQQQKRLTKKFPNDD